MTRAISLSVAVVILVTVCFTFKQMATDSAPSARLLRVKPGELFGGDLKRIESLFEQSTGCVELEAPEGEFWLRIEKQVWLEGKKRDNATSNQRIRVQNPKLLVFSYKGFEENKDKTLLHVKVGLLADLHGGSTTHQLELPPLKKPETKLNLSLSKHLAKLDGPMELKAGQPLIVFAFCEEDIVEGHQPRERPTGELIEDQVKLASRAVAFVVSWEEMKSDEK